MSTRTVGFIFIFYTICSVIWFVFFALALNNGVHYPVGQFLHIVFLGLLFLVVFVQYSKKVKLIEIKHELYQSLYESDQQLLFLLDQNGCFIRVNDTVLKKTGFDKECLLGKHYSYYIKQELVGSVSNSFQEALQGKMTKCQLAFSTKEEKNFCAEARFNPIAVKGKVCSVLVVLIDVTEQKEQENLLYRTERLHVMGEMAAGIAHEIKNPLTSVRGFIQFFQSKDKEEQHKPFYKLILEELDRVNEIANDFLTFAKPKEPKKTLLNMEETVEDVKQLMSSEARLHAVTIQNGKREQEVFVNGDEVQLKQVLINVLKNAIEASKAGDQILIESETTETHYFLRVTDEGCGIEAERIVRLGEAFHTSKEGGTGLGLMVSKRILAEHGGSIVFKSVLEKGTTVEITLPYVPKSLV